MPDAQPQQNASRGWVIPFTDDELEAIYFAIEGLGIVEDPAVDAALDSVIAKIISTDVGNPRPAGAIDRA